MSQGQNRKRARISAASLAGDRRSRLGLAGSVMLHGLVIATTFFTWQHSLKIADQSPPVVPVDLVTIAEKTNIAPEVQQQPKIEPKVNAQTPELKSVPVPKVEVPPEQKAEVAPPPPKQAPSEPQVKAKPTPAVPQLRPTPPTPEKKKPAKFDVNSVLALLNKQQSQSAASARGKTGPQTHRGMGAETAMTMDLVDALRNQIAQCWSPPVGAPNASDLVVDFDLFLNPDGSVAQPPQLTGGSQARAAVNPYTRAAAEAARRAIYECAPYKLPANRYAQWREINPFHFDPRQMMGQ